ncbi:MAG: NADH-quinone oxidoreductase subunit C [Candidatus Omnitrophica bacterium]|nr:NADH-quinone oxidoreductase subunit C [Candidatus Omnitrophota bacterium]
MSIEEKIRENLKEKIIDGYRHSQRRCYFSIKPQDIVEVANFLFNELSLRFSIATAIDTPKGIEILYHFSFDKSGEIFSVRVLIEDKKNPQIDSLTSLFPAAEWIEREIWELFGVNFKGHPNLKHLLLHEDWPQDKHPLRKKDPQVTP